MQPVSGISNLAMAQLRRLPPGTLPPVVAQVRRFQFARVLITLKGQGLNETELHDLGQFNVRNQIATCPAHRCPSLCGKYRQIQSTSTP